MIYYHVKIHTHTFPSCPSLSPNMSPLWPSGCLVSQSESYLWFVTEEKNIFHMDPWRSPYSIRLMIHAGDAWQAGNSNNLARKVRQEIPSEIRTDCCNAILVSISCHSLETISCCLWHWHTIKGSFRSWELSSKWPRGNPSVTHLVCNGDVSGPTNVWIQSQAALFWKSERFGFSQPKFMALMFFNERRPAWHVA